MRTALGSLLKPSLRATYIARRSFAQRSAEVGFVVLDQTTPANARNTIRELQSRLPKKHGPTLDVSGSTVYRLTPEDIKKIGSDNDGHALIFSGDGIKIEYGPSGIAPSYSTTPKGLLTSETEVPPHQLIVLDALPHAPVLITARNPELSFAIAVTDAREVLPHEENIKRYLFKTISELHEDDAKRVSLRIQNEIFFNKNRQNFYNEVISEVYNPKPHIKSSGTLMNFQEANRGNGATQMHYHPGDRMLLIFTTGKDAGVNLNFCGVNENPEDRKDCNVNLQFPANSYCILNFDAFIHHSFYGDFVCISIHPKEGAHLIEAVRNGTLTQNILESATVFSGKGEWNISMPVPDKTNGREK